MGAQAQVTAAPGAIEGRPQIIDGETLGIGVRRVHLFGVDAPEPEQQCQRNGRPWRCGVEATYGLAALIESNWVTCRERASDAAGEVFVTCRIGGRNGVSVNEELVRRGWTFAAPESGTGNRAAEQEAKGAKVGLWSGSLVTPWAWRRRRITGKTAD